MINNGMDYGRGDAHNRFGHGIYFFEDEGKTKWWKTVNAKLKDKECLTIACVISGHKNQLLDLTKNDQRELLRELVFELAGENTDSIPEAHLEAVAIQLLSEMNNVGVVRGIICYGYQKARETGYIKYGVIRDDYIIICVKREGFITGMRLDKCEAAG